MPISPEQEQELLRLRQEEAQEQAGGLTPEQDQELISLKQEEDRLNPTAGPQQALNYGNAIVGEGLGIGLLPKAMSIAGGGMAKIVLEGMEAASEAGLIKPGYEAPTFIETVEDVYSGYKGGVDKSREQSPITTGLGEFALGMGTGVGAAKTAAGKALTQSINKPLYNAPKNLSQRMINILSKRGQQAAAGEASFRAYETGQTDLGDEGKALTRVAPVGAVTALGAGAAGKLASKLAPAADEGLKTVGKLANKYNIPVAVSQITDSPAINNLQKISREIVGSGWNTFKDKQDRAFTKALTNTFGQDSEKFTPELMDKAFGRLGKKFDEFGKGKTFNLNSKELNQLADDVLNYDTAYSTEAIKAFKKEIKNLQTQIKDGTISGERLNFARNRLNKLARKTNDFDKNELFKDAENIIVDILTEGDEAAAKALSKTKQEYKNLLVIEPVAVKAKGGAISPTTLNNRVSKIYGRAHTRGKSGDIGELARIGLEIMPEQLGSDTAQKTLYGAATVGLLANPTTGIQAGTAIGANTAYQKLLNQNQNIVNELLKDRFLKEMGSTATSTVASGAAASNIENLLE